VNWELCGIWLCINLFRSLFLHKCEHFQAHLHSRFSSFVKRKMKFFGHLYTSKVATKTYTYDSTMWCVRVCICLVGWQNTSYTVDSACTLSLSGLATAIHRCTLHFHCWMPPRDSPTGTDRLPLFSSRPGEPSKRSRTRPCLAESFHWRGVKQTKTGGSIGGDGGLVSSME